MAILPHGNFHSKITFVTYSDFGQPLNRVARLLSTGYGGQTILSQVTYDLVRDSLPPLTTLKDLGEHRLKDLARPERVFQLAHPSLPGEFPALKSLDSVALPNNLPQQVTSFIGREKELASVQEALTKSRLLTLTGSGGSGKSRLSLQAAADLLEHYPDGVWLVELAPLADPGLVPQTVAGVLGVKEETGKPVLTTLTEQLKAKTLLLLLDNCEHILDSSAKLADALIRNCPGVQILATSREGLGIAGEATYRVPSLSLPDPKQTQTAESLSQFEAVRLFIDRALQTQPSFTVTNENAPALASICFRLDGIPLALELAAARARSLSVEDINSKLDQRFRLLTGGSRTALPRQQTLRSLIDWSYDLLNEVEQALFCRLSVFAGGWTLESAEAICVGDPVEDWEVLDYLTSLCDKSLVVAEASGTTTRYRMLETVRQYARDRLLESTEGETYRDKHLAFFLALGEEVEQLEFRPEMKEAQDRVEQDLDNIRAALDWSENSPERAESGIRLVTALTRFWQVRGHGKENRERLTRVMEYAAGVSPSVCAKGLHFLGIAFNLSSEYAAAHAVLEESLKIRQELGERLNTGRTFNALGLLAANEKEYALAQQFQEQSLAIYREVGHQKGIPVVLNSLGFIAYHQGDLTTTRSYWEEGLKVAREVGNAISLSAALVNLGELAYDGGDYATARTFWTETLAVIIANDLKTQFENIFMSLGGLLAMTNSPLNAARLWGASEREREVLSLPITPQNQNWLTVQITAARAALNDDAAFDAAWQEGRKLTLEQAVELALKEAKETPETHD